MAVLSTGQSFSSGDQVTAQKLNDIIGQATFTSAASTTDDSTLTLGSSKLKVADAGITSTQLATDSVITTKIQDDAVTSDKLAHISNLNVLGNVSGSTAAPVGVEIKDEDNMASDSATALATQQSIKAYVDAAVATVASPVTKYSSGFVSTDGSSSVANSATLSFTHNLGTDDLIVQVYMAQNGGGSGVQKVELTLRWTGAVNSEGGAQVNSISTTQLNIQLAQQGWLYLDSNGDWANGNWGTTYTHIKVVVIG